jgi:hypothetical protein
MPRTRSGWFFFFFFFAVAVVVLKEMKYIYSYAQSPGENALKEVSELKIEEKLTTLYSYFSLNKQVKYKF